MSTEVHDAPQAGIATLLGSIVDDFRLLLMQQVELLKQEVRVELNRAKRAAIISAIGLWICGLGTLVLLIAAAYALAAHSEIPLWGCLGIVGMGTALIGGCLLLIAKREASDVKLMPPPETAGAIKENYQWITGQKRE